MNFQYIYFEEKIIYIFKPNKYELPNPQSIIYKLDKVFKINTLSCTT